VLCVTDAASRGWLFAFGLGWVYVASGERVQALAPTLQQITDSLVIIEDDLNKLTSDVKKVTATRRTPACGRVP
jgi:hypothetical protein